MPNTAKQSKHLTVNQPLLLGHKFKADQQKTVLKILKKNPRISSSVVIQKMKSNHDPLCITERHLNRVRSFWGLSRDKGRPKISDLKEINSTEIEISKKKTK